jgi:hypothetical protein
MTCFRDTEKILNFLWEHFVGVIRIPGLKPHNRAMETKTA